MLISSAVGLIRIRGRSRGLADAFTALARGREASQTHTHSQTGTVVGPNFWGTVPPLHDNDTGVTTRGPPDRKRAEGNWGNGDSIAEREREWLCTDIM